MATTNNAVDFTKTFGAKPVAAKEALPKAEYWLNIGYGVDVQTEAGQEHRFVSLPMGIPLDTQTELSTKSSNAQFAQFQAARNDLHAQIMAVAETLKPGEDRILKLEIQLRRVNEDVAEATTENNAFARVLAL
ncbi:MAG: hypothetical protein WC117_00345 [Sphaerochaetaceae bacterium]|jgi:hypothetical protein